MNLFVILFFLFLGVLVGSFLNVVIFRMNTGRTLGGRSHCFSCRQTLEWFELIPVLSFLIQRGRCRNCGSKISKQYIIIETITSLLFTGISLRYLDQLASGNILAWITVFVLLVIISILIVISVYDIYHKIVPDTLVFPLISISLVLVFTTSLSPLLITGDFSLELWSRLIAGVLIPLPFFIIWLASRGRLMGFGDIKMMIAFGLLLGATAGITAVVVSFWIGALVSLGVMGLQHISRLFPKQKRFIMSTEIPFAPFLAIGLYLVIVTDINLLTLLIS